MNVSIVIRTKNEAEAIEETLKSVEQQDFTGDYEVIIVDSGSTDSTLNILRKFDVELIKISQEEFTYGRSLNIGACHAKGEFIVNLSAHALPRDGKWLKSMMAGFEDKNVAGVYGRQLSMGRLNPFEEMQNRAFFGGEKIRFSMKKMFNQLHFSNSNSALRKEIWERFKFDEEVPYAEDMLWQTEVMKAGFSIVYTPDAAVSHTHRVNIRSVYRNAKGCAYTLAFMKWKRQSVLMIVYDLCIFLGLIPNSIVRNLVYILENNYNEHLKMAPLYVISSLSGWLGGRVKYRLNR